MALLRMRDLVDKRVLVSRETARELRPAVTRAFEGSSEDVDLDFSDTELISPSFFDELLGIAAPRLIKPGRARELRIVSSPSDLGSFQSIAETYNLTIEKTKSGWLIRRKPRRPGLLGR